MSQSASTLMASSLQLISHRLQCTQSSGYATTGRLASASQRITSAKHAR